MPDFWKQGEDTIRVAILGAETTPYLYEIQRCLDSCGVVCGLTRHELDSADVYGYRAELEVSAKPANIDVICGEISPLAAVNWLGGKRDWLKTATHIINVIPLKWFSEFRYNIDDQWDGIDRWIQPCIYQRTLYFHSAQAVQISWVLANAEKAKVSSGFFHYGENDHLLAAPPEKENFNDTAAQDVVKNFLYDIGEAEFFQQMGDHELVGLGFSSYGADGYLVSEHANLFWVLRSFSQVLKTVDVPSILMS